jgi:hypothetical protein
VHQTFPRTVVETCVPSLIDRHDQTTQQGIRVVRTGSLATLLYSSLIEFTKQLTDRWYTLWIKLCYVSGINWDANATYGRFPISAK